MKHCKVSRETRKSTAPIKNIFNMQYVNDPVLPSMMASDMNSVNGSPVSVCSCLQLHPAEYGMAGELQ